MFRLLSVLCCCFLVQTSFAQTRYYNLPPTTYYAEGQEQVVYDYSGVVAQDLKTGRTYSEPTGQILRGYNPDLQGWLQVLSGRLFTYVPAYEATGQSEKFNMMLKFNNGDSLWPDYTVNSLSFNSLIQLLDVPTFDTTTSGGIGNILITAYDRQNGQAVVRNDLMYISAVNEGGYAPQKGVVMPHASGLPDLITYVANPGERGYDRVLVFARNKAGKMGYNFFNIYIP
ncbi:hypothetical protein N9J26_01400 [bacterium]|nr:hypothetical protein [bacterium]